MALAHLERAPAAERIESNSQQKAELGGLVANPPVQTEPYEADCSRPQNREESDLCEQRRMAKASEELVARTDWQIALSYWEIGGLLLSVLFTAIAARAAALAARAANRSVELTEQTAKRQLRAYDRDP
jgi:hypothetical protein